MIHRIKPALSGCENRQEWSLIEQNVVTRQYHGPFAASPAAFLGAALWWVRYSTATR